MGEINKEILVPAYAKLLDYYIYFNRVDLAQDSRSFLRRLKKFIREKHGTFDLPGSDEPANPEHVQTQLDVGNNALRSNQPKINTRSRFGRFSDVRYEHWEKEPTEVLLWLLEQWENRFWWTQARAQLAILGIVLVVIEGLLLAYWSALGVFHFFRLSAFDNPFAVPIENSFLIVVGAVLFTVISAVSWKLKNFLTGFLGDVMQWTTFNESQLYSANRKKIIETIENIVLFADGSRRPVVGDTPQPQEKTFDKIILVAHSLGSAITLDSLITIFNKVKSEIGDFKGRDFAKITHFITLGSPIDKIHYFFESHPSNFSHHNYFMEQNRGNLKKWRDANVFKKMNWINFYDCSDVISGPVYSHNTISQQPENKDDPKEFQLVQHVWNVPINYFTWGSINNAHSSYFHNVQVISTIWDAITENLDNRTASASNLVDLDPRSLDMNERMVRWLYPKIAVRPEFPRKLTFQVYTFSILAVFAIVFMLMKVPNAGGYLLVVVLLQAVMLAFSVLNLTSTDDQQLINPNTLIGINDATTKYPHFDSARHKQMGFWWLMRNHRIWLRKVGFFAVMMALLQGRF
jgi:hypothetical protein